MNSIKIKKALYPIFVIGIILVVGLVILFIPRRVTELNKISGDNKEVKSNFSGFPLTIVDALGRDIWVKARPQKVISLAPSLTQTIFALGAFDRLVGRTRFCLWPPEAQKVKSIGGLAVPEIESMVVLAPDLVLATTLTSIEVVQQIEALGMPIATFKQEGIKGTFSDMQVIGRLIGVASKANVEIQALEKIRRDLLEKVSVIDKRPRTLLLYGMKGLYSAKVGTFPSDMIELAGGDNVVKTTVSDWPQLSMESIIEWNPEVILVTLHINGKEAKLIDNKIANWEEDIRWKTISAVMNHRVYFLDDTLMSIPGPMMVKTAETMAKVLHPELFLQSQ